MNPWCNNSIRATEQYYHKVLLQHLKSMDETLKGTIQIEPTKQFFARVLQYSATQN